MSAGAHGRQPAGGETVSLAVRAAEVDGIGWMFIGIVALFTLIGLYMAVRMLSVLRLVRTGEHADGWCADRKASLRNDNVRSTTFIFAFHTPDGRRHEFRDHPGALGAQVGDRVRVSYLPSDPAGRATIAGPGRWGPVYGRALWSLALLGISLPLLIKLLGMLEW